MNSSLLNNSCHPGIAPRISSLRSIPFFKNIPEDSLELISRKSSIKSYGQDQIIFRQGDSGDCILLLLNGELAVTLQNEDGKEIFINIILAGEILGEIAMFDEKKRTANAISLQSCTIIFIPKSIVISVMEKNAVATMDLAKFLCQRVRDTMEYAENYCLYKLEERLARLFYFLFTRYGEKEINENKYILKRKIIQSQLGSMVNASRPKVNQCLQNWQTLDIVTLHRDSIIIQNIDKLVSIAKIHTVKYL